MHGNRRVVCVTPAGRRRYMRLLAPQILSSGLVDRWDLWVNTTSAGDRAFFRGLAGIDGRVRLVEQPDGAPPSPEAIGAFSRLAMDAGTVYVRFDDDVVWTEPDLLPRLLAFRAEHPEYFLVMPLILNNAVCTNVLQTFGKIVTSRPVAAVCLDKVGWRDGEFAHTLHRFVLDLIRRGELGRLHCGAVPIAHNRFSINCICWFGEDMARAGGVRGVEEEEEISVTLGARMRRVNCFCTDTAVAHFSFYSQRERMEESDVLSQYDAVLAARPDLAPWRARVDAVVREADASDDGSDWGWPPQPRWTLKRVRRLFRPKPRKPPVTLAPGPEF